MHTHACQRCACVYMYIQMHTHTCQRCLMHTHACPPTCACLPVPAACLLDIYVYICVYIYVYMHTHAHTHTHIHTHTNIQGYENKDKFIQVKAFGKVCSYLHTYACMRIGGRSERYAHMHACMLHVSVCICLYMRSERQVATKIKNKSTQFNIVVALRRGARQSARRWWRASLPDRTPWAHTRHVYICKCKWIYVYVCMYVHIYDCLTHLTT